MSDQIFPDHLVLIGNDGQDIRMTNFWQTKFAKQGLCWLSANAGALRMLLPKSSEYFINEILSGKTVTIEPSIVIRGCIDIVFEDGTNSPFNLAMSPAAMDFNPRLLRRRCDIPFTVWTERGKLCSFRAKARFNKCGDEGDLPSKC